MAINMNVSAIHTSSPGLIKGANIAPQFQQARADVVKTIQPAKAAALELNTENVSVSALDDPIAARAAFSRTFQLDIDGDGHEEIVMIEKSACQAAPNLNIVDGNTGKYLIRDGFACDNDGNKTDKKKLIPSLISSDGRWCLSFLIKRTAKGASKPTQSQDLVFFDVYIPNPSPFQKKMIDQNGYCPTYCAILPINKNMPTLPRITLIDELRGQPLEVVNQGVMQEFFKNFTKASEYPVKQNIIPLTHDRWEELNGINERVNREITYLSDEIHYQSRDKTAYPVDGFGDCEDYAVEKRRQLIALGWPASALLVTVVETNSGGGHAVLIARTDKGDLVLDNTQYGFGQIVAAQDTDYMFISQQLPYYEGVFVDLKGFKGKDYKGK